MFSLIKPMLQHKSPLGKMNFSCKGSKLIRRSSRRTASLKEDLKAFPGRQWTGTLSTCEEIED
jgi:hypothetical protein